MPKSKRAKVTTLSKTPLRTTKASKSALVNEIRACIDRYEHVWLFTMTSFRNEGLKELRGQWRDSGRFFLGKTKVMAKALGDTVASEYQPGLHGLSKVGHLRNHHPKVTLTPHTAHEGRHGSLHDISSRRRDSRVVRLLEQARLRSSWIQGGTRYRLAHRLDANLLLHHTWLIDNCS